MKLTVLLTLLTLTFSHAGGVDDPKVLDPAILAPAWSAETVAAWEKLPIQDGGRVKPLYTFAKYELVRTRSMESLRVKFTKPDAAGNTSRGLTPMTWLLDCFFYPDIAKQYFCFTLDDGEALRRVGLTPHPLKRDQYSYNELIPARDQLAQIQDRVDEERKAAENEHRDPVLDYLDVAAANLARNVGAFESLIQATAPLRRALPIAKALTAGPLSDHASQSISTSTALTALKASPLWEKMMARFAGNGDEALLNVLGLLRKSKEWQEQPRSFEQLDNFGPGIEAYLNANAAELAGQPDFATIINVAPYIVLDMHASGPRLSLCPPLRGEKWHSFGELSRLTLDATAEEFVQSNALATLQQAEAAFANPDRAQGVLALGQSLAKLSAGRDDCAQVARELTFRKWDFLNLAKWSFLTIFIGVALSWLSPTGRWAHGLFTLCKWAIWLPMAAIIASIYYRVRIGFGAPITNLYETFPVMSLVAVGLAVLVEMIFRTRLALGIGALLGCLGMFGAGAFEDSEARDTIVSLVPVLRTGVWLWTHVMCEAIAYGAGMIGGTISICYIFLRCFDLERKNASLFKMLTSCAYGILAFTLIFILVGTVLGGIWGNYSWGRFWGWDPKENGALVITLWCLAVLHMRLAGWIKEIGLHCMNVLGICTIIFSWMHVNELGVGLHSYGRTEGRLPWIIGGYCVAVAIALLGGAISYFSNRVRRQPAAPDVVPAMPTLETL